MTKKIFPEVENENCKNVLYFFVDITGHLSGFNLQLQGKKKLAHVSNYCSSKGFQNEIEAFQKQAVERRKVPLPCVMQHIPLCKHACL
jgi:nucleoid-associated protein YejK